MYDLAIDQGVPLEYFTSEISQGICSNATVSDGECWYLNFMLLDKKQIAKGIDCFPFIYVCIIVNSSVKEQHCCSKIFKALNTSRLLSLVTV